MWPIPKNRPSQSIVVLSLFTVFLATIDGSSETGIGELANEAAVKTYLDTYTSAWKEKDDNGNEVDFNLSNMIPPLALLANLNLPPPLP